MIFILIKVIFNSFFRVLEVFFQLFHPFCYDSQNCIRFDKENTIINLFLCVRKCILWNFSSDQIFCVSFHFLSIFCVFLIEYPLFFINFSFINFSSFFNRNKYFLKGFFHKLKKSIIFSLTFFNHKVDHSHNLICIISTFTIRKR